MTTIIDALAGNDDDTLDHYARYMLVAILGSTAFERAKREAGAAWATMKGHERRRKIDDVCCEIIKEILAASGMSVRYQRKDPP